ncbi:hypothetical protein PSHT_08846 [Puccinia striiformis]|uniref:Uncharacterized protein n=1 Tax=Puccinia striiformis TaxID=27350 RepID=A0A2S4VKS5_9BASI|nr:hypothetical protein PSHT_08846 [Puccinia striiformis]
MSPSFAVLPSRRPASTKNLTAPQLRLDSPAYIRQPRVGQGETEKRRTHFFGQPKKTRHHVSILVRTVSTVLWKYHRATIPLQKHSPKTDSAEPLRQVNNHRPKTGRSTVSLPDHWLSIQLSEATSSPWPCSSLSQTARFSERTHRSKTGSEWIPDFRRCHAGVPLTELTTHSKKRGCKLIDEDTADVIRQHLVQGLKIELPPGVPNLPPGYKLDEPGKPVEGLRVYHGLTCNYGDGFVCRDSESMRKHFEQMHSAYSGYVSSSKIFCQSFSAGKPRIYFGVRYRHSIPAPMNDYQNIPRSEGVARSGDGPQVQESVPCEPERQPAVEKETPPEPERVPEVEEVQVSRQKSAEAARCEETTQARRHGIIRAEREESAEVTLAPQDGAQPLPAEEHELQPVKDLINSDKDCQSVPADEPLLQPDSPLPTRENLPHPIRIDTPEPPSPSETPVHQLAKSTGILAHIEWCKDFSDNKIAFKPIDQICPDAFLQSQPIIQKWLEHRIRRLGTISLTLRRAALSESSKIESLETLDPLQEESSVLLYSTALTQLLMFTYYWDQHDITSVWNPDQAPLLRLLDNLFGSSPPTDPPTEKFFEFIDKVVIHLVSFSNPLHYVGIQSALEQFIAISFFNQDNQSFHPALDLVNLISKLHPKYSSSQIRAVLKRNRMDSFQPLNDTDFNSPYITLLNWKQLGLNALAEEKFIDSP